MFSVNNVGSVPVWHVVPFLCLLVVPFVCGGDTVFVSETIMCHPCVIRRDNVRSDRSYKYQTLTNGAKNVCGFVMVCVTT